MVFCAGPPVPVNIRPIVRDSQYKPDADYLFMDFRMFPLLAVVIRVIFNLRRRRDKDRFFCYCMAFPMMSLMPWLRSWLPVGLFPVVMHLAAEKNLGGWQRRILKVLV